MNENKRSVRPVRIGNKTYTVGVHIWHNQYKTNQQKVWDRYAGTLVTNGGESYQNWRGETEPITAGSFVHHFPDKHHHLERNPEGWHEYTILMDRELFQCFESLGLFDTSHGVQQVGNDKSLINSIRGLYDKLSASTGPAGADIVFSVGKILERILLLSSHSNLLTEEEGLLEDARSRLEQDIRAELNLELLAQDCSMSYSTFRRLFRDMFGLSPAAYRNKARMSQACRMLSYSRVNIAEVAEALGYSDQFIFSRQFKKQFGISPKKYSLQHCIS